MLPERLVLLGPTALLLSSIGLTPLSPRAVLLEHATPISAGVQRGDWETPDAVAVVYNSTWSNPLTRIVRRASDQMHVVLLADEIDVELALGWLRQTGLDRRSVEVVETNLDSSWIRDFGPLQVKMPDGKTRWLDADYYATRPDDDLTPRVLAQLFGVRLDALPIPIEGGGLISNGAGLCAMTQTSFLATGLVEADSQLYDWFLESLGCRALTLVPGVEEEPTGHIDMIAQFTAHDTVVVATIDAKKSPRAHARLDAAAAGLARAAAALGQRLRIVRVPMPTGDLGVYRSFVNGLRLDGAFLVPLYDDVSEDEEAEALAALGHAMPGIEIIAVPADEMVARGGAVHCATLGLGLSSRAQAPVLDGLGPTTLVTFATLGRAPTTDPVPGSTRTGRRLVATANEKRRILRRL